MKKTTLIASAIASAIALLCTGQAQACTTILVGSKASSDGSMIIARNDDDTSTVAQHMIIHPANNDQHGVFKSNANDFTWKLPEHALAYTGIPSYGTHDKSMEETGFNSAGVGITATESIYASAAALKVDPYVTKTGITEDAIPTVVLPYIHSARQGVKLLGKIIEEKGAGEGFGVAFVDSKEIWYLETGSGHQWLATRLPADAYFVTGNQGRLTKYDPDDKADYLASPTLVSFAEQHGLYNPKDGAFNFSKAYTQNIENDHTYNYPRVWTLQHMFNPGLNTKVQDGPDFPVFLKPEKPITLAQVKEALRNHYQGTSHDPYVNSDPKEPWRPVSVFRTQESHIMQVRPDLPKAIGEVSYVSFGMSALGVYVPYYQGISHYLPGYDKGTDQASDDSVNWKFRKLQTLVMQDYNAYAPEVQKAYAGFEKQTAKQQKTMEHEYLYAYKQHPEQAKKLLQKFEDKTMHAALDLTDKLTNEVFTQMTHATDMKYHFEGA